MINFRNINVLLLLIIAGMASAIAGISIDSTRIVFLSDNSLRGKSIGVTSSASSATPYLVKTLITGDAEGRNIRSPFITTPSLFRLEPKSTNQVLIVKKTDSAELPGDRESVFYFRAIAMPAGGKQNITPSPAVGGVLQVSTATVVKLFYRPDGLPLSQQQAMSMLQFSSVGAGLKVTNPTPYYITLADLKVAGVAVPLSVADDNTLIAPFDSRIYNRAPHQGKVEWKALNDYGGTEAFHGSVR